MRTRAAVLACLVIATHAAGHVTMRAAVLACLVTATHAVGPVGLAFSGADFGSFANATALKAALLENYDVTTPPPRANLSRGVLVRVQFAMQQFTLLDTTNQFITFHSWWRHYWVDPRLSWDPEDWGGVSELQFVGAGEQQNAWQLDRSSTFQDMMRGHSGEVASSPPSSVTSPRPLTDASTASLPAVPTADGLTSPGAARPGLSRQAFANVATDRVRLEDLVTEHKLTDSSEVVARRVAAYMDMVASVVLDNGINSEHFCIKSDQT